MSKLAKAITSYPTGRRYAGAEPFRNIAISHEISNANFTQFADYKEYSIGIKFKAMVVLSEEMQRDNAVGEDVLRSIKRDMIEEIFGEFRPIILEMSAALYDRDNVRVNSLLSKLEHQMFYEGL